MAERVLRRILPLALAAEHAPSVEPSETVAVKMTGMPYVYTAEDDWTTVEVLDIVTTCEVVPLETLKSPLPWY